MRRAHRSSPVWLALTLMVAAASSVAAADWPQWRGPNRDGISQEKGLLQRWPPEGPQLVWKATDIGSGYSTPAVVGDRLYVLANEGLEFQTGQVKWKDRALGAASLCFADGRLYLHGENGEVALVEPSPDGYREPPL